MARKAKSPALYTVKVRYQADRLPLISYFVSQKEATDYEYAAAKKFGWDNVEYCPSYKVYGSAAEALETLDMWIR